ncbi:MAG TPA: sodium/proline symporter [Bacteroidales bacterium]|nr:sodium/proline symporter [Bacteroidales bacterium]
MLIVFILYLLILVGITIYTANKSRNSSEYVLGGRKIPGIALALSERSTGESAWLILGLTGEAFAIGLQSVWVAVGCVTGIVFIWTVMSNRLRLEAERTGALTVSGILYKRFPGAEKTIGLLSASIVVFFFLFYVEAQFYGSGKVLEQTFGIPGFWGVIIGSLIVVFYTMLGGFITVVYTDVLQAILMIITLIVLPVILIYIVASDNVNVSRALIEAGNNYNSITGGKTGIPALLLILSGLSWMFGYTGQPQLLTRMMAIKDKKDIRNAKGVAIVWTIIAYAGALMIGIFGFVLMKNHYFDSAATALSADAEKILPVLINTFVGPVIAGLLLSGAISAMMSTASSEIIVSSSSITEDMYGNLALRKKSGKKLLTLNRLVTLGVGLLAFVLALTVKDSVYGLVSYAWSGIGSSFGPALLLILFWKRISRAGVIASLISGTAGTIVWKLCLSNPAGISERLTSFVFALLMAALFSYIFPEKNKNHI